MSIHAQHLRLVRLFCIVITYSLLAAKGKTITPNDTRLHYIGRHRVTSNMVLQFDWVGSGFGVQIHPGSNKGSINVSMSGGGNRFIVYRNGEIVNDFFANAAGNATYKLTDVVAGDIVSCIKATELGPQLLGPRLVSIFALVLDGVEIAPFGDVPLRRIEVYGDSDSASFGVDGKSNDALDCILHMWRNENFAHGWVSAVAKALAAEVRVQAQSGVGVFKNAADIGLLSLDATLSTRPMPELVKRTLASVDAHDYDETSWRPSVIVVYIGSNDYINLFPPSEVQFKSSYTAMLKQILVPFDANEPPVVHVCAGEGEPCNYIKAIAHETGSIYTDTGDFWEPKLGCQGHRNAAQQALLARRLTPIIATAAGWDAPQGLVADSSDLLV